MKRPMYQRMFQDLSGYKQMVFVAGPRQAGKTFLTKMIAQKFTNSYYFNWDIIDEKRKLIENPSFYENINLKDDSTPLVIFDELHKFPDWKNYLKNVFDRDKDNFKFIVSGSGRLDLFQKGGDSLAGRYLLFHLWPFTLAELSGSNLNFEKFIKNPLKINLKKNTSIQIWEDLK
ncbi:MAG TPA: hypothetical protein ENK36_01110, partial [Desulfobacterales bacterium]|nr:hypothetical protein [Desulfobacterales bacterium]